MALNAHCAVTVESLPVIRSAGLALMGSEKVDFLESDNNRIHGV